MSATTNVTSQNKNETDFPIDVGKSLRVMNLNKGQIIVKNLDPGDERVELSSSSSRLNAEKAENGDVYIFTIMNEEQEETMKKYDNSDDIIIECKIPPRFVSLDVLMGRECSLTVDANIAEANVDVTVVDEDDDETEDNDNAHDGETTQTVPPPPPPSSSSTCVRFLKSIKGAYVNVETLNGHVYCETIQANASIKTNGGNVMAKRIAANDLRVDTGNGGNIHIDSVFVHDCKLQTNKGNIIAKKNFRASGKTKCASNGGDIMLENVECGDEDAEVTVDARSQHRNGGDISIQFAPRCTSVLVYTNNEGSIKARVPSGFPAVVVRREENQPDEVVSPETKEGSFESTSTIINPSGENRDVSTFGARIVHDTDDLLARKIRAEYEKQSSVVFSLGDTSRGGTSKKLLSLVETSWLDEVLSSKREEGLDVEK